MITDANSGSDEQVAQRERDGRFAEGNQLAKGHRGAGGNPELRRLRAHQYACYRAAKPEHVRALMARLYQLGMAGDVQAAKAYLDRACGKVKRHQDDNPKFLPHPSSLVVAFIDHLPAGAHDNGAHRDLVEGAVQLDPPDSAA